jgi:hypothetical protein
MYNYDNAVRKLKFTVSIPNLKKYYTILSTQYDHLHWSWAENSIHLEDPSKILCVTTNETIMHGWPLQSDMADSGMPPSMLKSKHARIPWYDTELMFGIVKNLKSHIPYSYRWTLFVLPPGGKVVKHNDPGEYVVHIPIEWGEDAKFILGDHPTSIEYTLPADGSAYVVDVEIPHETVNNSSVDRVGLIFRIKREHINLLMATQGHFE